MTHTNTYVIISISAAAYDEIRRLMKAAGHEDAFDIGEGDDEEVIDMHGIALKRGEEIVTHREVISLKANDLLVLSCPTLVSERMRESLRGELERIFPDLGLKGVVLDGGVTLDVLRKESIDRPLSHDEYAQMQRLAPSDTPLTTMDQKLHDALYERYRKYGRVQPS